MQKIFAGQKSVGYDYAFYKALRDAGLDVHLAWGQLSHKEKNKIEAALIKELSSEVPVIIDPLGRVFAVDQHHDMYALLSVLGADANPNVPIKVLRDFSKESITHEDFKRTVIENGWVYAKTLDDVLANPVRISDMTNSVERSVIGMAFLLTAKQKEIPLKGKYFSPFVQFLLSDFLVEQNHMTFSSVYSRQDVEKVMALIAGDVLVRNFLKSHLIKDAHKDLKNFFED